MNLTKTAWDYKNLEKEDNLDAFLKIMRMLANFMTIPQIGQDFFSKKEIYFKDVLKKVKFILENKKDQHELVLCALSLLSNLCYFEKTVQISNNNDLELRTLKTSVLESITDFVIQTKNGEIQIEALRVLANLSRN